ncbi:MAG: GvpL/GvpF family gas vesicle protein [Gaiellaceae bacterium]
MAASATSTGVYVYGVVRADELPAVSAEGVGATSVELLEREGLAAIVSRLPDEFRVKRRDLDRHLQVLEEAFAETTVVPCAFGTVLVSDADVETGLLSERRDELWATLTRLEGMVQLNVKAVYDQDQLLSELVTGNAELARLRAESARLGDAGYHQSIRLGELVAALLAQRRETDASSILAAVSGTTEDVVIDDPGEYDALKASFLVKRKQVDRFDARLEDVARTMQPLLRIEVIGPLPPTAFAGEAAAT